jgi:molecular chaperone GrpE
MFDFDDYRPARRIPVRAVAKPDPAAVAPVSDAAPPEPEPAAPPQTPDDWKELALRQQAEMVNFRKRQERRADEAVVAERERLLRRVLSVLDNLERALDAPRVEPGCAGLAQGVELTRRELVRLLESEGVSAVPAAGVPFTPELHEAISTVADPARAGRVVEVVETGYTLNDRLLRPARVVVAA